MEQTTNGVETPDLASRVARLEADRDLTVGAIAKLQADHDHQAGILDSLVRSFAALVSKVTGARMPARPPARN